MPTPTPTKSTTRSSLTDGISGMQSMRNIELENMMLSCRRETARRSYQLKIWLSL